MLALSDQINLRAIQTLKSSFGCKVGYSDHSLGSTASIAAVALGAVLLEKHLTLDCNMSGPDHKASLEPVDFESMVRSIRICEQMLGNGLKYPQQAEQNTRLTARRSIRAARQIPIGTRLCPEDLICKRPADGICPMEYNNILGRITNHDYDIGDLIDGF